MEDWIKSHLRERAIISIVLVIGGVLSLVAGGVLVAQGVASDSIWFEGAGYKVTAKGFGAITLLSGVVWGVLAYLSRPSVSFQDGARSFSLVAPVRAIGPSPITASILGLAVGLVVGFLLGLAQR
jgi:hypothetical protein